MSEFKGPRVAKTIFSKKEKKNGDSFTLINLNLLPSCGYQDTDWQWHWPKDIPNQWSRIESPEINPYTVNWFSASVPQ